MEDVDTAQRPYRVSEGRQSRAQDTQDLVFAGEMAEAAREILTHPGLTSRERRVWKLFTNHATYEQIAAEIRCSYRDVSAIIDRVHSLMLHPTNEKETDMKKAKRAKGNKRGAGRPPTMHVKGADGLTVCGKAAAADRLTTVSKTNCKTCMLARGTESPPVLVLTDEAARLVGFEPLEIPAQPIDDFRDLESTIEIGVRNAHRKIVEISGNHALSSADVADNERAVHTLLSVRRGELEYLKRGYAPGTPAQAPEKAVTEKIDVDTHIVRGETFEVPALEPTTVENSAPPPAPSFPGFPPTT